MYRFVPHGVLHEYKPTHHVTTIASDYVARKMRITQNRLRATGSSIRATTRRSGSSCQSRLGCGSCLSGAQCCGERCGRRLCEAKFTAAEARSRSRSTCRRCASRTFTPKAMAAALRDAGRGVAPAKIQVAYDCARRTRLERWREARALWINDSKATNVDSVLVCLESMKRPPGVDRGGRNKGNDYGPVEGVSPAEGGTRWSAWVGNANWWASFWRRARLWSRRFRSRGHERGQGAARPGDAVLFRPPVASFDFSRYEHAARCSELG